MAHYAGGISETNSRISKIFLVKRSSFLDPPNLCSYICAYTEFLAVVSKSYPPVHEPILRLVRLWRGFETTSRVFMINPQFDEEG